MAPPRARARFLTVAALCVLVGVGCVTVDGTLKADGSGTVEVTYGVMPNTIESAEKYRFTASKTKLESFKINGGTATAKLSFDDPAKLSTVDVLKISGIDRRRDGDTEHLTIRIANPPGHDLDKIGTKPGPRIKITLPGPVLEANRNATVDGNTVAWRFDLVEFLRDRTVELIASYRLPAPAGDAAPKDGGHSAD